MSKKELEEVLESIHEAVKPHRHTLVQRDSMGRKREDEYDMRIMIDKNKNYGSQAADWRAIYLSYFYNHDKQII